MLILILFEYNVDKPNIFAQKTIFFVSGVNVILKIFAKNDHFSKVNAILNGFAKMQRHKLYLGK